MYVSGKIKQIIAFPNRGENFRKEFSNIGEIRALLPCGTNVMALTATANVKTRMCVMETLKMVNICVISKVPNNPNLFLSVLPKPSEDDKSVVAYCNHNQ